MSLRTKIDDHFGQIIRQGRENRKLTQEQLAELVEIDQRTIQRWEAEISIPWLASQKRIATAMPEISECLHLAIKKIPGCSEPYIR